MSTKCHQLTTCTLNENLLFHSHCCLLKCWHKWAHAHTRTARRRRHHHQPPSYHSPHSIPHIPLTINKSNGMLLPIFVTVPFIWCILNERICACVSMCLCGCRYVCMRACIECHANAKVQNDLDSFYLHCYSSDLFIYCIRTMVNEGSSKSKLIT